MAGCGLASLCNCGRWLPVRLPGKSLAALMSESKTPVFASTASPAATTPVQPDRPALGNRSLPRGFRTWEGLSIYARRAAAEARSADAARSWHVADSPRWSCGGALQRSSSTPRHRPHMHERALSGKPISCSRAAMRRMISRILRHRCRSPWAGSARASLGGFGWSAGGMAAGYSSPLRGCGPGVRLGWWVGT
jgi:hypothetical protein